jgi:pimeloyl-ACP methyl ester carboxylesterase
MSIDPKTGLYFEEYGQENPRTIVFLHGGGIAGWMWRYQVEYFKGQYHCLVPDLPGQGQSAGVGIFSIDGVADSLAEFIRSQAHEGKANVVGLSEGAVVVVALLSRHPEQIDHAVSSSAILRPLPGGGLYSEKTLRWTYRWFMAPFKNNDGYIRLNMHSSAGVPDEFFADFKQTFQQTTEDGFARMMSGAISYRLPAHLQEVTVPVLVVVGQREYKQMIDSGRDLLHALPNAHGVMVSLGQGSSLAKEHNWAMTAPQLFNATVAAWIEDRSLPAELLALE